MAPLNLFGTLTEYVLLTDCISVEEDTTLGQLLSRYFARLFNGDQIQIVLSNEEPEVVEYLPGPPWKHGAVVQRAGEAVAVVQACTGENWDYS